MAILDPRYTVAKGVSSPSVTNATTPSASLQKSRSPWWAKFLVALVGLAILVLGIMTNCDLFALAAALTALATLVAAATGP